MRRDPDWCLMITRAAILAPSSFAVIWLSSKVVVDRIQPNSIDKPSWRRWIAAKAFACAGRGRADLRMRRSGWLRGQDSNLRPSGYEPDELPGCSTPRHAGTSSAGRQKPQGNVPQTPVRARNARQSAADLPGRPRERDTRRENLSRPGNDLLSHVLRRSTIGAKALNGRVRDGTGCFALAMVTKPGKVLPSKSSTLCACFRSVKVLPSLNQIKPIGQLVPVN